DGFNLMTDQTEYGIFCDMGCGKSAMLINDMCRLYTEDKITGALIVAPKGVYMNWVNVELPKHLWENVPVIQTHWMAGAGKKHQETYKQLLYPVTDRLYLLVMNVEAFSTVKGRKFAQQFVSIHDAIMVVDESTCIKTPNAARTKAIIAIGRRAKYRRILTGMPVTQSPMDLYSQCEFLAPGKLGFNSFYSFRGTYAKLTTLHLGPRIVQKVAGYKNLDDLTKRLGAFSFRVSKTQVLDLPPKVYQTVEVGLSPEQEKLYKKMRRDSVAYLEGGQVTAMSAMTQLLRLHQIMAGHVTKDDGTVEFIPHRRIQVLMDLLEEISGKVIIWSCFQSTIRELIGALRRNYGIESTVSYYGETTEEDRAKSIERFQSDPTCRFFVGTPSTGGYGLTLTAADTVVYYMNSYSVEQRVQSEDRAHRIGQTKSVTYIDLLTPGTVDEKVLSAIRERQDIAALIMRDGWKSVF
ncbi:MAG: DEAD/DEAH box helicase, partial [Nitrososphaera sp.]|nr:DEAD/DEAH box helicase [Nitrososphaera sp.]